MPAGVNIAALATSVRYIAGADSAPTYAAAITTSGVTATPTFTQGATAYSGSAVGTLSTLGLASASALTDSPD